MGDTRTVYRLETPCGDGAFSCGAYFGGVHSCDEFRAPYEEPRMARRWRAGLLDEWVCGFQSLDEARRWFPPRFLDELENADCEFTTWEVPRRKIAFGRDQVMFDRDAAECIERKPAASLYQ